MTVWMGRWIALGGWRSRSGSDQHLPAPALSHGFGGEAVAMSLFSAYLHRGLDQIWSVENPGGDERRRKSRMWPEWRYRGRGLPIVT
jgi:hypothetical protein